MKIVSLDEAEPFYLLDSQGEHDKTYILVCVDLLIYKCHLIPLTRLYTLSFIRALEILQSLRGHMTTIILDDASFHNPLRQSEDADQDEFRKSALQGLLDNKHHSELHKSGIDIVIASSKRHERVGRAEHIIKKIKFLLASALKTWIFHDSFNFTYNVAIINHYLNERPLFHTDQGICTPLTLEQSLLARSNVKPKFFTFAEYLIPSNKEIYKQIKKLTDFNKKILFEVAANNAFYLLNKRTLNQKFKEQDLV